MLGTITKIPSGRVRPGSCLTRIRTASIWIVLLMSSPAALARPVWDYAEGDEGREPPSTSAAIPAICSAEHNVGRMALPVTNKGFFGQGHDGLYTRDCFTNNSMVATEYPKGSYAIYMTQGAIWVGAVVDGRDTLVSTALDGVGRTEEFNPDVSPFGDLIYRSTLDPTSPRFEDAVSEQDYVAIFSDTCLNCSRVRTDFLDGRPHRPLHVEVTQRSYAWSYSYAQDFVLFDYEIKNIGKDRLREVYIGLFIDGDVYVNLPMSDADYGRDDLVGFKEYQDAFYMDDLCPPDSDLVNMAWTADNNGDLHRPQEYARLPHITGARIIRTPSDSVGVSFNWWSTNYWLSSMDYGPQARATFRDLGFGNLGTPWGDRNSYHFMRNGEHDFDQALIGRISSLDAIWVPPPAQYVDSIVAGVDGRYLLSFGPFALDPGQTLPTTFAYIAGANFHRVPDNLKNLPDFPELWYENVYFDSLETNAIWAEWIYDNPGIDTDSDGYAGEFTICNLGLDSALVCDTLMDTTANPDTSYVYCYWDYEAVDTVWRKGDGVPDFRGATPPPNPALYKFVNRAGKTVPGLRAYPGNGSVRLVWNGVEAENALDAFTREYDFEGYKVYIARDDRTSSYSLVASYDRENYSRWVWNHATETWSLKDVPFTLDQLRYLYGDSTGDTTWHPDNYPRTHPLIIPGGSKNPDRVYYFEPTGFNRSVFANDPVNATTDIRRVYPDAIRPRYTDPDSISVYYPNRDDTTYFTPDGYLKYYEYEYTFDGLLPTVPYYFNVTAVDYGFPELGLAGLENDPSLLPTQAYPLPSSAAIAEENLPVFVYPNPYRLDGNYRAQGYEARGRLILPDDKTRLVHFANLPPKCTISIFSIDGDLIRQLEHDVDPKSYTANHATWDLINKNLQLVVSGLYYWVIDNAEGGTQVGKLVVIM